MGKQCAYCGEHGCLFSDAWRPSSATIDGKTFSTCGRYLPAGEYIAVQKGQFAFAYCRKCFYRALAAGVSADEFEHGDLAKCIPCGYHSARMRKVA